MRLKDVATVELGSEFYDLYSDLDGHPSAAIVIKQSYGSNAHEVIQEIKAKLADHGLSLGMTLKDEIREALKQRLATQQKED